MGPLPQREHLDTRHESQTAGERLRITQALTRQASIEMVASDPTALADCLSRVHTLIASPTHRATAWRDVALLIEQLATSIPDDID